MVRTAIRACQGEKPASGRVILAASPLRGESHSKSLRSQARSGSIRDKSICPCRIRGPYAVGADSPRSPAQPRAAPRSPAQPKVRGIAISRPLSSDG